MFCLAQLILILRKAITTRVGFCRPDHTGWTTEICFQLAFDPHAPHVCDAADQSQSCVRERCLTPPTCLRIKLVCEEVSSPPYRDTPNQFHNLVKEYIVQEA